MVSKVLLTQFKSQAPMFLKKAKQSDVASSRSMVGADSCEELHGASDLCTKLLPA